MIFKNHIFNYLWCTIYRHEPHFRRLVVSSPTASIRVVAIVLTIAAAKNRHEVTMDIAGAYRNAPVSSIVVGLYVDSSGKFSTIINFPITKK